MLKFERNHSLVFGNETPNSGAITFYIVQCPKEERCRTSPESFLKSKTNIPVIYDSEKDKFVVNIESSEPLGVLLKNNYYYLYITIENLTEKFYLSFSVSIDGVIVNKANLIEPKKSYTVYTNENTTKAPLICLNSELVNTAFTTDATPDELISSYLTDLSSKIKVSCALKTNVPEYTPKEPKTNYKLVPLTKKLKKIIKMHLTTKEKIKSKYDIKVNSLKEKYTFKERELQTICASHKHELQTIRDSHARELQTLRREEQLRFGPAVREELEKFALTIIGRLNLSLSASITTINQLIMSYMNFVNSSDSSIDLKNINGKFVFDLIYDLMNNQLSKGLGFKMKSKYFTETLDIKLINPISSICSLVDSYKSDGLETFNKMLSIYFIGTPGYDPTAQIITIHQTEDISLLFAEKSLADAAQATYDKGRIDTLDSLMRSAKVLGAGAPMSSSSISKDLGTSKGFSAPMSLGAAKGLGAPMGLGAPTSRGVCMDSGVIARGGGGASSKYWGATSTDTQRALQVAAGIPGGSTDKQLAASLGFGGDTNSYVQTHFITGIKSVSIASEIEVSFVFQINGPGISAGIEAIRTTLAGAGAPVGSM